MSFLDYVLILITIPIWIGLGRFLIKDLEPVPALLAGISISGGTIAATCRIIPIFSREILIVFACLGCYQIIKEKEYFARIKSIPFPYPILLLCMAILFRRFHFTNWMYESHSIVYFDSGIEMLKADYFGNLRVSVSYPSGRAAMHLNPTSILAALVTFVPKPNLFHFIEARYLLTVVFFSDFTFRFLKRFVVPTRNLFSWPVLRAGIGLICAGALYANEFTYNIGISSFFYIFCLLRLFSLAFENRFRSAETFFFLVILCSAKAPIILVAFFFTAAFAVFHMQYLFRKEIIIAGFILCINAISWKLIPPPSGEIGRVVFHIPHSVNDFFGGGALQEPFANLLPQDYVYQIIYVFFRIYVVFFVILMFKKPRHSLIMFLPFMLLTILDLIFIRDGNNLITHQRDAYYLAGVVTAFAIAEFIATVPYIFIPGIVLARISMVGSVLATIPQRHVDSAVESPGYYFLSYDEYLNNIHNNLPLIRNGFYTPDPHEPYWLTELKASMLGVRVKKELVHPNTTQNINWILN